MRIAVLGMGIMGRPMARNLAAAGHEVTVWNRTRARAEALSDCATVADEAAQAVEHAEIVLTMVENSGAVIDVISGEHGAGAAAARGTLFVDCSSVQPSVARDLAADLRADGKDFVDAPVSGGEKGATEATLAIMAGGSDEAFARAKPALAAMGTPTHVGPVGAGQVAKLANQQIVAVTIGAVAEGLMLAQEGGCDPAAVRRALMGGFATSRILDLHGERMIERNWKPGGPLRMQLKDLDNALEVAEEAGLRLPLTEQARAAYFDLARNMPLGENDHAAYLRWLEEINPGKRLGDGPDIE